MNRTVFVILVAWGALCSQAAAQDPLLPLGPMGRATAVTRAAPAPLVNEERAAPALTAKSVASFFDAAFNVQRLDHAMVGAVVSVVYRGEILFKRGYGWADLEERVPVDPDRSLFRIASITKPFVWTAIMQLVEQGRIELDAEVSRYIDFEIPATYEEPIRIWHLLSHTPGFEERGLGGRAQGPDDVGELGAALKELMPARVRPPGEHAAYSNYGAALAGYIVQRVSGQPWAEYLEEHILEPLGMSHTNARTAMSPALRELHAKSYRYQAGEFVATDFAYLHLGPAGHMSSTATDMASFMLAHLNEGTLGDVRILQERTARLMHSPLFLPHPELLPIVRGFYRSDRNGQVVYGHGGDTNQFHSNMSLLPDVGLGVFVSFNADPAAAARTNLVPAFLDHFFPADYLRPPPEPVDVGLSAYAGEYIPLRNNFSTFERIRILTNNLSVELDGDELKVGAGGRLVATGPDRFTGRYGDAVIVFERGDDGEVTHLIANTPLSTYQRVRGLESPTVIAWLLSVLVWIAVAAVLGWGYRVVRRAPEAERLPSRHIQIGWLHALLLGGFLLVLPGTTADISYGIPVQLHALLLIFNANLLLCPLVVGFSVRQWSRGYGTVWSRARYSLVALAALGNLWFGWFFNLVDYLP